MTLKKVRNVAGSHRAKLLALVSDRRVSGGPLQADLGLRDLPALPLVGKQIAPRARARRSQRGEFSRPDMAAGRPLALAR